MGPVFAALYWWLAILDRGPIALVAIPLLISAVFFLLVTDKRPIPRVLRSAHGLLLVLALGYAVATLGPEPVPVWRQVPVVALFALSFVSFLYSLWGEKRRYLPLLHVFTVSYALIIGYRTGMGAAGYAENDCWLPDLVVNVPVETLMRVGDRGDRRSDSCPVPVPRVITTVRPYGSLRFELWGSSHRLYMTGKATDGTALQFGGDGVDAYRRNTDSWLSQYSHYRRFAGSDFADAPETAAFDLSIQDANGVELEQLSLTYRTQRCRCRSGTF